MAQDKCTVQEAASILKINRRKIYRWIENGLLDKHIEDKKTYVILSEVKDLCDKNTTESTKECDTHIDSTEEGTKERTHYVVDKTHYEGLLIKLGQMESERRYLLEYKAGLEEKDRELSETKSTLAEAEKLLQEKNKAMDQAGRKIQDKDRELSAVRAEIEAKSKELEDMRSEIKQLKTPWYRRIWKR